MTDAKEIIARLRGFSDVESSGYGEMPAPEFMSSAADLIEAQEKRIAELEEKLRLTGVVFGHPIQGRKLTNEQIKKITE